MKLPHNIARAAAVMVALAGLALLAHSWIGTRRDIARLSGIIAAQNELIQQASAREQRRRTELAAALAAIAAAKRRVQTPRQAAEALPSVLPPLPLPVLVRLPDLPEPAPPHLTPDGPPVAAEPPRVTLNPPPVHTEPPPATITIPQLALKPLHDALLDCRACALERDAAKQDLADHQLRINALTTQRDAAIATARGGTFWSRLKQATKWVIIGAIAGATASAAATRH